MSTGGDQSRGRKVSRQSHKRRGAKGADNVMTALHLNSDSA